MNFLSIILAAITMNNSILLNEDNILLNASLMKTENQWRIVNDGVMAGAVLRIQFCGGRQFSSPKSPTSCS